MIQKKNNSVFTTIGASNHSEKIREKDDYYATEPLATELLLEKETFTKTVLEPCVGGGHIAEVLKNNGYNVICSDIVDRGYPNTETINFLVYPKKELNIDIVTNPPYKFAKEFVEKAMDLITPGHKVAMFLKLTFLEGVERYKLFQKYPIKTVYVATRRLNCAMNGDFETYSNNSALAYAWFIWEKGYSGDTIIKFINTKDLDEDQNLKRGKLL